ncbi:hypothetical protein MACK_003670 [Theileria orientalis]|uniref:Uncharacterized protein n=1 Tax=Theileria orientalis TaxID=68886 RepID=A0A976SJL7_THEOR|nr:hypothetical protein MACK_003670 [Theileria orientalis]
MIITKCLLLVLFLYGKNTVKTTDKSVVASPGFVACAGSGGVTSGSDSGLTFAKEAGSDDQVSTSGGDNEVEGSSNDKGLTDSGANGAGGTSSKLASPTPELKLFKDDSNNNKVEIKETDFYEDQYLGNLTYAFKPGVKCTIVKFEDKDVWKKGEQSLDEPKSVTYNFMHRIVVRNAKKSVAYRKDDSGNWVHYYTVDRTVPDNSAKTSGQAGSTGSSGSGLSLPKPESETGSGTGLRGTPAPTDTNEEADETSTVSSPEAGSTNEVSTGTGLRGTSVSAEPSEEAEQTSTVSSPEAGTTNESGQGATREENETDDGGGKEATTDADGSSASASDDAGSTGGEGSGHVAGGSSATPPASSGGDGTSGGADSDGGGTDTSSGEGSGTNDDGTGKGAGEHTETGGEGEDGSQPSGGDDGSKTGEEDTGTTGGDGGTQLSTTPTSGGTDLTSGPDGSSATPPASSGGEGTSATPGQDGTATSPTAGSTNSSNKTSVDLSLKATAATNEFDYNKVDKVVTYTAKDKYAFKSVKTKTGGCYGCGGSDVTIWDAKDASEYATKVVLNGKGKKEKIVTIHMSNNSSKSYKKDGKGKPWNEYTGPLPSTGNSATSKELKPEEYPKEIKLFMADSNDATKSVEINTSEYKVKKEGDEHIYELNNLNCTLIKCGENVVWQYGTTNSGSSADGSGTTDPTKSGSGTPDPTKSDPSKSNPKYPKHTQASTKKSTTDGSGGTDQSGGGTTGTGGGGTQQSTPATQ